MKVSFGRFELDSERRLLLERGNPVHVPPKALALLETLVTNAPRALSKDELSETIWKSTVVEESNLAGLIADLRTVLGDDARKPHFIRTVHGFGYAFVGEVAGATPRKKVAAIMFRGQILPLFAGENVLGRDASADVQVDDSTVSRRHARIVIGGDSATIEDLGSKNGTLLDEQTVGAATALRPGQTIVLGDARLVFKGSKMIGSTVTVSRRA